MKIKAPLSNKTEVAKLCQAGADELFCGIETAKWRRSYRGFAINQRMSNANFLKIEDLAEAINIAHKYNTKVHVAINAFFHLEDQYKIAIKLIKDILDIKADGFIFADVGLLLHIDKKLLKNKDVVIGTDAVIFNSAAVNFYKSFGATRIVFPRAMTLVEMKEVTYKDKNIEHEVFIINDLCYFIDGLCAYCKEVSKETKKMEIVKNISFFSTSYIGRRGYNGGCRTMLKKHRKFVKNGKHLEGKHSSSMNFTYWDKKHIQGCGACAIYDFKKIDMTSLKVLDRNLPTEEKIKATLFIRNCLNLLSSGNISRAVYIKKSKDLFEKAFKDKCNQYDCYYPSVFHNLAVEKNNAYQSLSKP